MKKREYKGTQGKTGKEYGATDLKKMGAQRDREKRVGIDLITRYSHTSRKDTKKRKGKGSMSQKNQIQSINKKQDALLLAAGLNLTIKEEKKKKIPTSLNIIGGGGMAQRGGPNEGISAPSTNSKRSRRERSHKN